MPTKKEVKNQGKEFRKIQSRKDLRYAEMKETLGEIY